MEDCKEFTFVIVGGGIGGVVCAETLCELISPSPLTKMSNPSKDYTDSATVCLISATPILKMAVNLRRITNLVEDFDVKECPSSELENSWPKVLHIIHGFVKNLIVENKLIKLSDGMVIKYEHLCIATGGIPISLLQNHDKILTLRDTESVASFQNKLKDTRRLVVVGNGGIATEVVHEVSGCEVIWLVKHKSISTPYLDPDAAKFLINAKRSSGKKISAESGFIQQQTEAIRTIKKLRYSLVDSELSRSSKNELKLVDYDSSEPFSYGSALGPDWAQNRNLEGAFDDPNFHFLKILYEVEVDEIFDEFCGDLIKIEGSNFNQVDDQWPIVIKLNNGQFLGCDLILSAIGVKANVDVFCKGNNSKLFKRSSEKLGGGLCVNEEMETSVKDIYSIGDAAYADWPNRSPHWFQMRLWTQARSMGFQAAKAMDARFKNKPPPLLDIAFDLFTHVTTFFGFKIVMLGCYNGQGMDLTNPEYYLLLRITDGFEYIKCVMCNGKMQGALLLGECNMEETFENLILDQLCIKDTENGLLDPDIDIDDYFD